MTLVNLVAFQVVWFSSVLGAAAGQSWLGTACVFPFMAWQLTVSTDRAYDIRALGVMCLCGILVDSAYPAAGIVAFASPWPSANLAPGWLVVMWLNLALTMNHSLRWLRRRYWLAAVFGGIGGGFSYWAGERLGAVEFLWPPAGAAILIGLVWAVVLPCAYALLERSSMLSNGSAPIPR